MELLSFAKEVLQNAAEHAASYRVGQTVLRYMDRALWVMEKSARWAVPPPLDQDETPQPELIRPLNWVFFLSLLLVLRVTRESISLINLALGKPPLRSADVVIYIQSKRRYLRTLKYSGGRALRCRTSDSPRSWGERLVQLLQRSMCYRTSEPRGDADEVMIVKRKRSRQDPNPAPVESSMERLIEKMMVDLEDSDESSSYTLTNVTSPRSDRSDCTESDQDMHRKNKNPDNRHYVTSTPEKLHENSEQMDSPTEISTIKAELNGNSKETTINFIREEASPEIIVQKHKKIANGRTQNNSSFKERNAAESWYSNSEK